MTTLPRRSVAIAKPRQIMVVAELPKTRSGKIMRRLLKDVAENRPVGDVTTLADSGVMDAIRTRNGVAARPPTTSNLWGGRARPARPTPVSVERPDYFPHQQAVGRVDRSLGLARVPRGRAGAGRLVRSGSPVRGCAHRARCRFGHISAPLLALGVGLELASIGAYSAAEPSDAQPVEPSRLLHDPPYRCRDRGRQQHGAGRRPNRNCRQVPDADPRRRDTGERDYRHNSRSRDLGAYPRRTLRNRDFALHRGDARKPRVHRRRGRRRRGCDPVGSSALLLLTRTPRPRHWRSSAALRAASPTCQRTPQSSFVGTVSDHLDEYHAKRGRLVVAVAWAAANWLLDAAALWVLLLGVRVPYRPRSICLSPTLSPAWSDCCRSRLADSESSRACWSPRSWASARHTASRCSACCRWRLVQYWLPIPLAAVAYASLKSGPLRRRSREPARLSATTG